MVVKCNAFCMALCMRIALNAHSCLSLDSLKADFQLLDFVFSAGPRASQLSEAQQELSISAPSRVAVGSFKCLCAVPARPGGWGVGGCSQQGLWRLDTH